MANVKEILIIFALLMFCLFASCRTAEKVTQNNGIEVTTGTHADSTHTGGTNVQAGEYVQHTTHVYDSVFTHVTIYRYDTLTQKVVEKIVIEQQAHHADNSQTIAGDTTHVIVYDSVKVVQQDTTAFIDHTTIERVEKRARGFMWGVVAWAAVLAFLFALYIYKKKG